MMRNFLFPKKSVFSKKSAALAATMIMSLFFAQSAFAALFRFIDYGEADKGPFNRHNWEYSLDDGSTWGNAENDNFRFPGQAAGTTDDLIIASNLLINNLTYSMSAGTVTINPGISFSITVDGSGTSGEIVSFDKIINNGTLSISASGGFSVAGDVENNGTITQNGVFNIGGDFTNQTTATLSGSGSINLDGDFTDNGTVSGTVKLSLNGAGSTFTPQTGTTYSNIEVNGSVNIAGELSVAAITNNGTISGTGGVTVTGSFTDNGNWTSTGKIVISGAGTKAVFVNSSTTYPEIEVAAGAGKPTFSNNLNVTTLDVLAASAFADNVNGSALNIQGASTFAKNVTAATLDVQAGSTFSGAVTATTIDVQAGSTFSGNVNAGTLDVQAASTFTGTVDAGDITTGGTGTTTFGDKVTATGDITTAGPGTVKFNGDVEVTGIISTAGTTTFAGSVDATGNVTTSGITTFSGQVDASGDITTSGTTSFSGAVNALSNVIADGTTKFNGITNVTGIFTNNGTTTFGGETTLGSFENNDTVNGAGNITVQGDFTNNSGVTLAGSGNFTVEGDFVDNGTWIRTGRLIMAGSGAKSFTGNPSTTYPAIEVASGAGIKTFVTDLKVTSLTVNEPSVFKETVTGATIESHGATFEKDVTSSVLLTIIDTTLQGSVSAKDVTTGGITNLTSSTTISGKLTVNDTTNINDDMTVAVIINNGTLGGTGAITVTSSFTNNASGTYANNQDLTINGAFTDNGSWSSSGKILISGTGTKSITVNPSTTYPEIEVAAGAGKPTFTNNLSVTTLNVQSASTFNGTVDAVDISTSGTGTTAFGAEVTATGSVSTSGTTSFGGAVNVTGDITTTGTTTFSGTVNALSDVIADGTTKFNGTINVTGIFTNNGTTTFGGETTLGSLDNNDTVTGAGNITVQGDFTNRTGVTLSGSGNFTVEGDFTDDGNWLRTGTLIMAGSGAKSFTGNPLTTYPSVEVAAGSGVKTFENDLSIRDLTLAATTKFNGTVTATNKITGTADAVLLTFEKLVTAKEIDIAGESIFKEGISASTIKIGKTTITGTVTGKNITLGETLLDGHIDATETGGQITFTGPVTISNAAEIKSDKKLEFTQGIQANGSNLTLSSNDEIVIPNGLFTANKLTIEKAKLVRYGGTIQISSSDDFIISYPAILVQNTDFDVGGNFIIKDHPTNGNKGSINCQTDPCDMSVTCGSGKTIQILNTQGIGNTKPLNNVIFNNDAVIESNYTIKAASLKLGNDGSITPVTPGSDVKLTLSGDLINENNVTYSVILDIKNLSHVSGTSAYEKEVKCSADVTVNAGTATFESNVSGVNLTNDSSGTINQNEDLTLTGNLSNEGTYFQTGDSTVNGTFTNSGTYTQTGTLEVKKTFENTDSYTQNGVLTCTQTFTNSGDYSQNESITAGGNFTNSGDYVQNANITTSGNFTDSDAAGSWSYSLTPEIKLAGAGNNTFNGIHTYYDITVTKTAGSMDFTADVEADNKIELTGSATDFKFQGITANSVKVNSSKSFTAQDTVSIGTFTDAAGCGNISFTDGVISNDVVFNTTGKVTVIPGDGNNFTIGAAGNYKDFTHTAGETVINGKILAKNILTAALSSTGIDISSSGNVKTGTFTSTGTVKINATGNLETSAFSSDDDVDITAVLYTLNGNYTGKKSSLINADLSVPASAVINTTGLFKTADGKSITFGGSLSQTGSGKIMLGGGLSGTTSVSEASFASDVYIYGTKTKAAAVTISAASGKSISITGNLVVASDIGVTADANKREITIGGSGSTVAAKNVAVYSGKIRLSGTLSSKNDDGDIVLLGPAYDIKDTDTGILDEYRYDQPRQSSVKYIFESAFPDGTSLPDGSIVKYSTSLSADSGAVLHCGQNFYANGVTFSAASEWFINIKQNSIGNICFAEAYNCTINNSTVRNHNGAAAAEDSSKSQIVAENCTLTSCKNWDDDIFEIVSAKTVRDNVVLVEVSSPVRNYNGEFNGRKATASSTAFTGNLNSIKYSSNGSETSYSAVYLDEELTNEIQGDITTENSSGNYYFYIKAATDDSWNTDATGTSSGTASSTDRNGNHKNSIPFIQIPRAIDSNNTYIVTDIFGKRIKHYGTVAKRFTAVNDATAPALISVKTGQEAHADYAGSANSQQTYDAHNFIEFRYSEQVDFADSTTGAVIAALKASNVTTPTALQNVKVLSNFGVIREDFNSSSTAGTVTFAGLGQVENGLIYTETAGASDKYVNSIYRADKFSVKISIAGYVDTAHPVSSGGSTYNNWIGYIEKAEMLSGTVTIQTVSEGSYNLNKGVVDLKGNYQRIYSGSGNNTNKQISIDSTAAGIYGKWDLSAPEFAFVHKATQPEVESYYEILGGGSGSVLDCVEVHITDNTSSKTSDPGDIGYWITAKGWCKDINGTLWNESTSYSADILGGARPYAASDYTTGGLRYCTFYNQQTKFKYAVGDGVPGSLFNRIAPGGSAPIFEGSSTPRRNVPTTKDNTYLKLYINETNLDYETTFTVSYDDTSSYITDLAGNRLRSSSNMKSINRTPPTFDLIIAPVGSDEIFIEFVKSLTTEIKFGDNSSSQTNTIPESFEEIIPYCFEIGTISSTFTANSGSALQIDYSAPAVLLRDKSNNNFTGIKLKLNRTVTLADVNSLYIRVKAAGTVNGHNYGSTSLDPFTNIRNSHVTFIQDYEGNYMQMYSAHAISDFAVNVIMPEYAYNPDYQNEGGDVIHDGVFEDDSWAVHDWGENQGNFGTLKTRESVLMFTKIPDTVLAGTVPDYRMYFTDAPTELSASSQYNIDLNENARVWIPELSGFTTPLYALSPVLNTNFRNVDGTLADDVTNDIADGLKFEIDSATAETWQPGKQVSFLFGLMNGTSPYTICHSPVLNVGSTTYDVSTKSPLFALRLKDDNDVTSFDLWSFRIKDIGNQRGGATILNNVIDPTIGEKTILRVNTSSAGRINIMVMTLDGSIVTYLNREEVSSGEHFFTWDGKNDRGNIVARGLYFIRIVGNGIDETRKVMVVKE